MTNDEIEIYRPIVTSVANRLWSRFDVQRIGEISDVSQIGWIALLEALGKAKKKGIKDEKLHAYLAISVRHAILRAAKSSDEWSFKSLSSLSGEETEEVLGKQAPESSRRKDTREVREALEKLDPTYALILRMRFGVDRPRSKVKDIAKFLGWDFEKTRVKLRVAKRMMAEILNQNRE